MVVLLLTGANIPRILVCDSRIPGNKYYLWPYPVPKYGCSPGYCRIDDQQRSCPRFWHLLRPELWRSPSYPSLPFIWYCEPYISSFNQSAQLHVHIPDSGQRCSLLYPIWYILYQFPDWSGDTKLSQTDSCRELMSLHTIPAHPWVADRVNAKSPKCGKEHWIVRVG